MSERTPVVNKHSKAPFDVYIGRGSKWGNPFPVGRTPGTSRQSVVVKYEQHLLESPELLAHIGELHGKTLQCFCAPQLCHGDVLAYYADAFHDTGEMPTATAGSLLYPQPANETL